MPLLVEIAIDGNVIGARRCEDEGEAHDVRHQAALSLSCLAMLKGRPRRNFQPLTFERWEPGAATPRAFLLTVRELEEESQEGLTPDPAHTWRTWYQRRS